MYRIIASPHVQQTRPGGAGQRLRAVTVKGQEEPHLLAFDRQPKFLAKLPPEVAEDPHLLVTKVTKKEMEAEGGSETRLLSPEQKAEEEAAELAALAAAAKESAEEAAEGEEGE